MSEEEEITVDDVSKGIEIGIELPDWLASKKRCVDNKIEGEVEAITDKAILIDDEWIPKSQVEKVWLL